MQNFLLHCGRKKAASSSIVAAERAAGDGCCSSMFSRIAEKKIGLSALSKDLLVWKLAIQSLELLMPFSKTYYRY